MSFDHLHLHFGELVQFLFFFLSGPVNFADFSKSFFVNGLGFVLIKLDDILAGLFFQLHNTAAIFLFFNKGVSPVL